MLKLENCKCIINNEKITALMVYFDTKRDEVTIIREDGEENLILSFEDIVAFFINERYEYTIESTDHRLRCYYASIDAYLQVLKEKGLM
jgi:hypothetical protein